MFRGGFRRRCACRRSPPRGHATQVAPIGSVSRRYSSGGRRHGNTQMVGLLASGSVRTRGRRTTTRSTHRSWGRSRRRECRSTTTHQGNARERPPCQRSGACAPNCQSALLQESAMGVRDNAPLDALLEAHISGEVWDVKTPIDKRIITDHGGSGHRWRAASRIRAKCGHRRPSAATGPVDRWLCHSRGSQVEVQVD